MEELKTLPDEFLKPLLSCFGILKRCVLLFFDDEITLFKRCWLYLCIIPCVVTFHSSQTATVLRAFRGELELHELAYVVPVYVVSTQAIFKAVIVSSNKSEIRSIILQLGLMWRTDGFTEEQINKKDVLLKRLKFCYAAFYWLNILGSWQYILAPLLETLFRKYILEQECGLLLPFVCTYPFDPTANWMIYIAIYVYEGFSMFRMIYYYLGTEFLMITLCAHLSTEFSLLQEDLLRVKPVENKHECSDATYYDDHVYIDESYCTIGDVVRRHQKLIKFAQQLDDIFNKMIFVNLSSATITICFFGFAVKVARGAVDMANNFVGVFASILPIFNLCYYGELLREASAGIADSAYVNLWYNGGTPYQKSIQFVILRSQRACCLTSIKYNPISLNTFTTMVTNKQVLTVPVFVTNITFSGLKRLVF